MSVAIDLGGSPGSPQRDPLGLVRRYRRSRDGREAGSLRALLPPREQRALDPRGVATAWGEHRECRATCFAGVESLARGEVPRVAPTPLTLTGWCDLLVAAAARLRAPVGPTAVALSGGLDSALVLALLRAAGVAELRLYTVSSGFAGYDERAAAEATAFQFGHRVEVLAVGELDFVEALPACVSGAETALYNLHPVERWLLARGASARGHATLVTGDGADQVFAGAPPAIFLPIVSALFEAAGVGLCSPFLAPEVVARGLAVAPDPEKGLLRSVAAHLGVPAEIRARPKRVRLAPPMNLARYLVPTKLAPLAAALGRPLSLTTDRERVQWATLCLLWELL